MKIVLKISDYHYDIVKTTASSSAAGIPDIFALSWARNGNANKHHTRNSSKRASASILSAGAPFSYVYLRPAR